MGRFLGGRRGAAGPAWPPNWLPMAGQRGGQPPAGRVGGPRLNPHETGTTEVATHVLRSPAAEVLPRLLEAARRARA